MLRMYHLTFLIPCGKSLSHGSGICCRFKGGQNDLLFSFRIFFLTRHASAVRWCILTSTCWYTTAFIFCWIITFGNWRHPLLTSPAPAVFCRKYLTTLFSLERPISFSEVKYAAWAFWRSAQNDLYKRTSPDVPFNEHLSISHRPCYRTVIDDSWSLDKRLSEWLQIVRLFFEA